MSQIGAELSRNIMQLLGEGNITFFYVMIVKLSFKGAQRHRLEPTLFDQR